MNKIGTALEYPIRIVKGAANIITGADVIEQAAYDILSASAPRFFLGEYKSKLSELRFEQNDEIMLSLLHIFISDAIKTWEKRTKLVTIEFKVLSVDSVDCTIYHRIIGETKINSFVYPFYKKLIF